MHIIIITSPLAHERRLEHEKLLLLCSRRKIVVWEAEEVEEEVYLEGKEVERRMMSV